MEKGNMILAIGFTILVGLYFLNLTRADMAASDNSLFYANKRQARQIALSGTYVAIQKFRSDTLWAGDTYDPFLDGRLEVSVVNLGSGRREVTGIGYYGQSPAAGYAGESHKTVSIIQIPQVSSSSTFPMELLADSVALEIQGDDFDIRRGTNFWVDGTDTTSGTGAKYAIGVTGNLTASEVRNEIANDPWWAGPRVVGYGPPPSVTQLTRLMDMDRQEREISRVATIFHRQGRLREPRTWGTRAEPKIVFVTRSLTVDKPLRGAGILFIDGDLTIRDSLNWLGYVMVHGDEIECESAGRAKIIGAVFFGKGRYRELEFGSTGVYRSLEIIYDTRLLAEIKPKMFGETLGKPSIVEGVYD